MLRSIRSWPLAARIEFGAAAAWLVLALLAGTGLAVLVGTGLANDGGTVWTLWGTPITERTPASAHLIGLSVVLAGVLLALPFVVAGVLFLGTSRVRALTGSVIAALLVRWLNSYTKQVV